MEAAIHTPLTMNRPWNMYKRLGALGLGLLACMLNVGACAEPPRYVFINRAPGETWHQERPESFTAESVLDITDAVDAPESDAVKVGVSFIFSILENPFDVQLESLEALLSACESANVPVLINVDPQNWWETRRDLWNWWDPKAAGYDPFNVFNVEWTDWSPEHAVKIGWRNWGSQIRVCPAPNLSAPRVRFEIEHRLKIFAGTVSKWHEALPKDKNHLFGGLKLGHETGIGYNAYYYPDGNQYFEQWSDTSANDPVHGLDKEKGLDGGLQQLGYAAVKTAGIKSEGALTSDDIGKVVQDFHAFLTRIAVEQGIPPDKIYTHAGGQYPPYDQHLPFWEAFAPGSIPGYSLYWTDPNQIPEFEVEMAAAGRESWAAVEWWWGASDAEGWADHFRRTFACRDCRFICIYNWNTGFSFKSEQAGIEGLRIFFAGYEK